MSDEESRTAKWEGGDPRAQARLTEKLIEAFNSSGADAVQFYVACRTLGALFEERNPKVKQAVDEMMARTAESRREKLRAREDA